MKRKNNLIIILVLFLSIGVTVAYFSSTSELENVFKSGTYKTVTEENYTPPTNWKPGDETPKTITTKNEGTIPVRVRIKLEESWTSKNNNNLPLTIEVMKKDCNINGKCMFKLIEENVSIINFDNDDDWIKEGDYYYYMNELAPGESTSSLIKSVTFNEDAHNNINCTNENNVYTCESTGNGYDDATYRLNIITETVQSDAVINAWNLTFDPTGERTVFDISDGNYYNSPEETNKDVFIRKRIHGHATLFEEIGFIYNNNIYYLKNGGSTYNEELETYNTDSIYYNENKETLISIFGSDNCEEDNTVNNGIACQINDFSAHADKYGYVSAAHIPFGWGCYRNAESKEFKCKEIGPQ